MNNVSFSECDSTQEVCNILNRVIDNQNQIEGKLLTMIESSKKNASKSWVKKLLAPASKSKKGSVSMKLLLTMFIVMIVSIFAISANAAFVTTDINYDIASNPETLSRYLRDVFANQTGETYLFTPTTTEPTGTLAVEGRVYYNDTSNELRVHNGTSFVSIDTASGNSLDSAYNLGVSITVDNGAVALTAPNANNNTVFQVVQSDTGTALGIDINNAGSGNSIDIEGSSGNDIEGTGNTWAVTTAGAATFVGVDTTGDITLQNDEVIKNDNNGEIEFGDGTEDTAFSWSTNSLDLTSDTGVVEIDFGTLDSLVGINAIAFDGAVANTITQTGTGAADDLTISQATSGQNASLILQSTGTAADAIKINASVAGLDVDAIDDLAISLATNATADDFLIQLTGATNSSILVTSSGTGADAISLITSAGGMDLTVAGAAAGEDLDLLTNSSINITATEADPDAIVIRATAAGGDLNLDSVLGRIEIEAEEDTANAVLITADGGTSSTLELFNDTGTSSTEGAASIQLLSDVGGIAVQSGLDGAAITLLADAGTSEVILLHSDQGTGATSINLVSDVGGITATASAGLIALNATGATAGDMTLTVGDDYSLDVTGDATFKGVWHPDSVATTTETTTTLDTTDIGKITKVTADAQTITLPATVVGYVYTIMNAGADGAALVTISPNASDKITGCDIAGADDEDLLNTKATADKGDYVKLLGDGVDGWFIIEMNGTWAEATP